MKKMIDARPFVNRSKFIPLFERLAKEGDYSRRRRAVGTFSLDHDIRKAIRIKPSRDLVHAELPMDPELEKLATFMAEFAEVNNTDVISLEAQRVTVDAIGFEALETRGAKGILCINRDDLEGGMILPNGPLLYPGLFFTDTTGMATSPVKLSDCGPGEHPPPYYGTMDCFLLHAH